jgi:hypothetical protein
MHRFLRIVSVTSLFALTWSAAALAGSTGDLRGGLQSGEPTVCAAGLAQIVFAAHETGDFCDSTADHGTSKSCKEEGRATGLYTCPAGQHVANLNCSVGQSCNSGNGSWCSCTYDCRKAIAVDPEPVDPHDGE